MANATLVNVLNTRDDLLEELAGLLFLQLFAFNDVLKEFATQRILHDQKKLARSLDNLIEKSVSKMYITS
jgi:hypothetical protein